MKAKYTVPGTYDMVTGKMVNLKPQKVEIVGLDYQNERHIDKPLLHAIKIKFEDGTSEWVHPDTITLTVTQSTRW